MSNCNELNGWPAFFLLFGMTASSIIVAVAIVGLLFFAGYGIETYRKRKIS